MGTPKKFEVTENYYQNKMNLHMKLIIDI